MKRAACLSSAPGSSRAAAGRKGGRRRQKQQVGKLQKLRLAVREFVDAAGAAGSESGAGPSWAPQGSLGGRRKRRQLRREKRKLKRGRRRGLLTGEEVVAEGMTPLPSPAASAGKKPKPPPPSQSEKQQPAKSPATARSQPSASVQARKRALLAANKAEEREIRRLERQLGLHKRRKKNQRRQGPGEEEEEAAAAAAPLPQSFARDGLDYVLGALESEAAFSGLYESSEGEEGSGSEEGEDEEGPSPAEEDLARGEGEARSEGESSPEESESEGEAPGLGSPEAATTEPSPPTDPKENPNQDAAKYIPPQMRTPEGTTDARKREQLERLKRTVKGLINRLSEPNLASISGQLEELYMANSRKDMNETLTNIVICACVKESAMPCRLLMEHVLLVSVLHQMVGIEVGAHFLETVVRKFDDAYKSEAEGKECENLLTLIANLYNFYVVHSLLIFDILKKLVSTFSGKDIELILLLLKNVGFSLRRDDALALKELITEAQKKANAVGKQFQDQSRVCFMLEIMLALRNNDMRKIPGYDPEPVEKLRKLLRTQTQRNSSGKDSQLRVSLDSLLAADQIGRWWIVGSSWSGAPMIGSTTSKIQQILPMGKVSSKILKLAHKQRMNTDIRRNIFCILMISEDFLDAFENLLKLRLKDQQEREIVHVLLNCCLQEKTYNPFYAHLSAKFCEYERRFQMTFQFSMWDKIRDLGNLSAAAFSNLVSLLTHLLKTKSLSLTVFKVIEFSELDKPKVHFLRQVLSALFLTTEPEELTHIFGKLADNPKLGMLYEGLKLFLTHFLLKNIHTHTKEGTGLKERIELVTKALKAKESKLML